MYFFNNQYKIFVRKCYIYTNLTGMAINRTINPFINDLHIPYIEVIKKGSKLGTLNEVIDSYEFEQIRHAKLFVSPETRNFIFSNLSMYARDMFLMLQYIINQNYTYVILTYEKIKQVYNDEKYGKRRYDETIRELHKFAIIDLKSKEENSYWYNPIYFSSGDRLKMYPECKVKIQTLYK